MRLASEDGQDRLEAWNGWLCDAVDVQTFLVRSTEVGSTLDIEVKVESATGRVVVCC